MNPWKNLCDEISTDEQLKQLSQAQTESIINSLTLLMYADEKATILEEAEFEDLLLALPWFEEKDSLVERLAQAARSEAKGISEEDTFRAQLKSAADQLESATLKDHLFRMAVTLAFSDLHLHPNETLALKWMAEIFEISKERADQLFSEAGL